MSPEKNKPWINNRIAKVGAIAGIVCQMSGLNPLHPDPEHRHTENPSAAIEHPVEQEPYITTGKPIDVRAELDTILDSMLITQRIPPGVPFDQRVGEVNDPRVRDIMREMDADLGGRIEWPNVYVEDGLIDQGAAGRYQSARPTSGGTTGRTVAPDENETRPPLGRYGITIDKQLVDQEIATGRPEGISIRSVLAHELQHATSWDHHKALIDIADSNHWSYDPPAYPTAEGKAGIAQLLEREISQRPNSGTRLNELPKEERRDAIAGMLTSYMKADSRTTEEVALYLALKDPAYLYSGNNKMWEEKRDDRTDQYAYGTNSNPLFVPTGSNLTERITELEKPLERIAQEWRNADPDRRPTRIAGSREPTPTPQANTDKHRPANTDTGVPSAPTQPKARAQIERPDNATPPNGNSQRANKNTPLRLEPADSQATQRGNDTRTTTSERSNGARLIAPTKQNRRLSFTPPEAGAMRRGGNIKAIAARRPNTATPTTPPKQDRDQPASATR